MGNSISRWFLKIVVTGWAHVWVSDSLYREKVVKTGGTIAMDITDMDLNLSKMAKGLGLYDEVGNTAAYGAKYVRYTDWELGQVLSNKDYFKRVVFYDKGVIQDKMKIYNKYYGN